MEEINKVFIGNKDGYIAFFVDTPMRFVSIKQYLIYRYALLAVRFKNWWFDNYFGLPLYKRNLWTKCIFIVGQIIIHDINKRYSFSVFIIEKSKT